MVDQNKSNETLKDGDNSAKLEQAPNGVHNIKLGTFQLQTKSFWISLVSILSIYILVMVWLNYKYYNILVDKLIEHEERLVEIIIKSDFK